MSLMLKRNSVRDFTKELVSKEDITRMLTSAMQAPSACNQQPWEFVVIDDLQILEQLSKMSSGAWMLANVNTAIAVIIKDDGKSPKMAPQDCAAATQNILLEAVNNGLGAVWIGVYPIEERMDFVNKLLNITKYNAFSLIALGHPKATKESVIRYDEMRIHHNGVK